MKGHLIRKTQSALTIAIAFGAVFFVAPSLAKAADYYVSPSGSDSNPGTQSAPFRKITYAYSRAVAGDRILALPGTYTDFDADWGLHLYKSGSPTAHITLKSTQRGGAILDGQNNPARPNGIYVDGSYNIVDGFKITRSLHNAVVIFAGSNNTFVNNEIYDNGKLFASTGGGGEGFYSDEDTAGTYYGQNYIHNNGSNPPFDHGFYLSGKNETVVNNIVVGQPGFGLQIHSASGMKVYNNLFANNAKSGIILWENLSNISIYNNILVGNKASGIETYDAHGSGVSISNNVIYRNGGGSLNLANGGSNFTYTLGSVIQKDPLFVGATDYHLQSSSPAIGVGMPLTLVTQDFSGNTRPSANPDIGPYQHGSGGPAPSPSPSPSPSPPPASVIQNGRFENGLTGWGNFAGTSVVSGSGNVWTGTYAIRVGTGAGGAYQDVTGVAAGSYTLAFAGKVGSSTDRGYVGVTFYDVNRKRIGEVQRGYANLSWRTLSLAVQVPGAARYLRVYVWKDAKGNYIFVDNVSLTHN